MPRQKKLSKTPDYVGSPQNKFELVVQKSNPLQSLSKTGMTLPEFKILDVYLSRIDSHDPEKRFVRFEKGELEELLGVKRLLKDDLSKRLDNLFSVVNIRDDTRRNGFRKIALFERAEAYQDDDGLWIVDLACTPSAMEYIFNLDDIGYLRYKLKNVIELTSRYSYIMFLYLENNRFRKEWTVDIAELKQMLNCTADTYNEYKRFNDLILKRCHAELHEKTTTRYTYEPTARKNRKYTQIKFRIETIADVLTDTATEAGSETAAADITEMKAEAARTAPKNRYADDDTAFFADAFENEFADAEVKHLVILARKYLAGGQKSKNASDLAIYDYFCEKYAKLNTYTRVKQRYRYLEKMIENDIKT